MLFAKDVGWLGLMGGWLGCQVAQAMVVDPTNVDSLKKAATTAATHMMATYTGNQPGGIPGLLPGPYFWWEAGAMFGQLIHYWHLTGDSQYNTIVTDAIQFQVGDNKDFMPVNQTKDLGNDDQVFWAFTAMDAAELNFPNPPSSKPSWLALAQAVFNDQVPRWETTTCGGGLRWQIYPFNAGYEYKNAISTGGLFQLSARLARFTGNQTYADWAEKTWEWLANSPIMQLDKGHYDVWDGTAMGNNCSDATKVYWTYNAGTMLSGSAYMFNLTNGNATWQTRTQQVLDGTDVFFVKSAGPNSPAGAAPAGGTIMAEVACEFPATQTCDIDQPSFKAYLSRWMAITAQLAPFTAGIILPRLRDSAVAAAGQCIGQAGDICGRRWYQTTWDGFFGVGEQMSALSVFQNNIVPHGIAAPLTAAKGGTSVGDPNAGGSPDSNNLATDPVLTRPMTSADKAGAGIMTAISLAGIAGITWWMVV